MPDWLKNKLFDGRRLRKENMLILFLCGILLFVILIPVSDGSGTENNDSYSKNEDAEAAQPQQTGTQTQLLDEASLQEYKEQMEEELEEFLSGISGVGEVRALIYMKASWEYRVEKDNSASADSSGEETVYTVNADGQEVPFVTGYVCPQIEGVAVVAQGAENEELRVRLVRLIMALYGLEANKVEVIN